MATLLDFVRLSRLHFLMGGFLMVGLGVATTGGSTSLRAYALVQLIVSASQLTAHYVNEYADYEADMKIVNRTAFSGGSGVLTSGAIPRVVALRAALATSVIAIVTTLALATTRPMTTLLGLLALAISWAYSMPPVRLLGTGWGEVAAAVTVAAISPAIGALSQQGSLPTQLTWMIFVLVALQIAMLLSFELPDLATDAIAGKRVLGVRLGEARTRLLILTLLAAATLALVLGLASDNIEGRPGWLAIGLSLPTSVVLVYAIGRDRHVLTTFAGVATFFLCGVGFFIGSV